jgi:hypothetical protein
MCITYDGGELTPLFAYFPRSNLVELGLIISKTQFGESLVWFHNIGNALGEGLKGTKVTRLEFER